MTARWPAAVLAVLLAGCVHTPTEGQKAAQRAAQPSVTVIQPTTVTKTCEDPCPTTTRTSSASTSSNGHATAGASSVGRPKTGAASAPTAGVAQPPAYQRDEFGPGWADPDHNGCDARQDAVRRAVVKVITRTGACQIRVADIRDVYSGRTYPNANTRDFDVDHVVAEADAWRSGAASWSRARRVAFANDPSELVLTTAHTNRSKGDQGPDTWAPTTHAGACWYARRYQQVKRLWRLHTTRAQRTAIRNTLKDCP